MERFEELLKQALEHKQPSPGFTERVLAAAKESDRKPAHRWSSLPLWLAPGLAVVLLLVVSLGYNRYRERQQGERASAQLVAALRLTGSKLDRVRARVVEIGDREGNQ